MSHHDIPAAPKLATTAGEVAAMADRASGEPPAMSDEKAATVWRLVMEARQALRDFTGDTTLAHNYSGSGSWQVWKSVANNTLIPDCKLSAHVNFTGQALREVIQTVVPNHASGISYGGEVARDHTALELKKATAVNRLAHAGAAMLGEYPGDTPRHHNMLQFMQDHVVRSTQWMREAATASKTARMPKPRAKAAAPGQQDLF